jgi:hypothetical protein
MKKPDAELTRWKQFGAFAQAFGVDGQRSSSDCDCLKRRR